MNPVLPAGGGPSASGGAGPRQSAVYIRYRALQRVARQQPEPEQPRSAPLSIACGMGQTGMEAALAAVIFGASLLGIDASPAAQKSAQRHRACDFLVHSLDEALRMLKLSLRKAQPIAVGLLAEPAAALEAILARGVQPQFLFLQGEDAARAGAQAAWNTLLQRGAQPVPDSGRDLLPAAELLVRWTAAQRTEMHRADALALTVLPQEDDPRRLWLQRAPACFERSTPQERICSLTAAEFSALQSALRTHAIDATLHCSAE